MKKRNIITFILIVIIVIVSSIIIINILNKDTKTTSNELNNTNNNDIGDNEDMVDFKKNIKLVVNDVTYNITLEDNNTSRQLYSMLPLTINMNDLNSNEKYYYLDNKLPVDPVDIKKINTGDIMLFGNNCLVLFYDSFNTSYSYTKIGVLDDANNLKEILGSDNVTVSIIK